MVDGVKHASDLHYRMKKRPWLMFGASVLTGNMLGRTVVQPQQLISQESHAGRSTNRYPQKIANRVITSKANGGTSIKTP
jgi:hypothetical protein